MKTEYTKCGSISMQAPLVLEVTAAGDYDITGYDMTPTLFDFDEETPIFGIQVSGSVDGDAIPVRQSDPGHKERSGKLPKKAAKRGR